MVLFKLITTTKASQDSKEVTRWAPKVPISEITVDMLMAKLQSLYGTGTSRFYLTWFDGEDYCRIHNSADLHEACEFATTSKSKDSAIRIFASQTDLAHKSVFGHMPDLDVPTYEQDDPVENGATPLAVSRLHPDQQCNSELSSDVNHVNHDQSTVHRHDLPSAEHVSPSVFTPIYPNQPAPIYQQMPIYQQPMIPQMAPVPWFHQPIQPMYGQMTHSGEEASSVAPIAFPRSEQQTHTSSQIGHDRHKLSEKAPKTDEERKELKVARHHEVDKIVSTLRSMGFTESDETLRPLIKKKKGKLNAIIDALNSH